MPWLSDYAKKKKIEYFLQQIPRHSRILEIGCGAGWVGDYLRTHGWPHYTGMDLSAPADVVGDILHWRELGLKAESFDSIIAFEVVEHVDCFRACYELLRPGGVLMITTPVPRMDRVLRLFEAVGLNQKRTSPHDHLVDLARVPYFENKVIRTIFHLSQWGIFTKDLD